MSVRHSGITIPLTLPETNSLHLEMDGWNTSVRTVSFWDGLFSAAMLVSGRVYIAIYRVPAI